MAHGLRAQLLILGTVWQQDREAAGHSVPTVWVQRQASVGAQFPFSVLLKSGSPTHRIVLFTLRVLHPQLNLSGKPSQTCPEVCCLGGSKSSQAEKKIDHHS